MADPEKSPKLTCGSIVLSGILAIGVVVALQRQAEPPSWTSTGAAALAVVAVFLTTRSVQGFFWGLVAALCLTFHPSWKEQTETKGEILAGGMVLAVLAGTGIAWRMAFHPRFAWRSWLPLYGALVVGTALAWTAEKKLGLLALTVAGLGLGTITFLGTRQRLRGSAPLPSRLNVWLAGAGVLLVPIASVLAYRFFDHTLYASEGWWPLVRDSFPNDLVFSTRTFEMTQLQSWCWPHPWAVLPLLAVAAVLSVRRGWKQWAQVELPTAWFLSLCLTVMVATLFFYPLPLGSALPLILTSLVVLLAVFVVADLLQSFFDRLVLRPPDERNAEGAAAPPG